MAANMYRVGDYVYFETSSASPYQIRRIEELNKTNSGNVEAKVMCFYRRKDISASLVTLADKHQAQIDEEKEEEGLPIEEISDHEQHLLRHRELFLSRQLETLPATQIRGKCMVTLLNETEELKSYLNREEAFFYSLVYDPNQKTLLADRGEIKVGSRYQVEHIPIATGKDDRELEQLETLVWNPHCPLTDKQIHNFSLLSRSVGTFARALDCGNTVRQPSLHMTAAAASRDITLQKALTTLHGNDYDLIKAVEHLMPDGGLLLCRDELEDWSASEASLFEEALQKYGKDFWEIKNEFLPWKTMRAMVEYYYMWKTTDRYVQQKRIKAAEAENKLKQVYIPAYNKPNPALLPPPSSNSNKLNQSNEKPCESCSQASSAQWYSWSQPQNSRLCADCWNYWKRYGGLKTAKTDAGRPAPEQRQERLAQYQANSISSSRSHKCGVVECGKEFRTRSHLSRHLVQAHGIMVQSTSPKTVVKSRPSFSLLTTPLTKFSRRLCHDVLKPRHCARAPFTPINATVIKQECNARLPRLKKKITWPPKPMQRMKLNEWAAKRGIDISTQVECLKGESLPKQDPSSFAFPRPSPETLQRLFSEEHRSSGPSIMRKRGYEQQTINNSSSSTNNSYAMNSQRHLHGPPMKRQALMNGNGELKKKSGNYSLPNGLSARDSPDWTESLTDEVYFIATRKVRNVRRSLDHQAYRHLARKPWILSTFLSAAKKLHSAAPSVPAAQAQWKATNGNSSAGGGTTSSA